MKEIPLTTEERDELALILKQAQYSRTQTLFINDMSIKYLGRTVCLTCGNQLREVLRQLLK